jgi:hypothetical protein
VTSLFETNESFKACHLCDSFFVTLTTNLLLSVKLLKPEVPDVLGLSIDIPAQVHIIEGVLLDELPDLLSADGADILLLSGLVLNKSQKIAFVNSSL